MSNLDLYTLIDSSLLTWNRKIRAKKKKEMAVSMFGCFLLIFSFCVEFASPTSIPCTLKVFDEYSEDHIEGVCVEEFESPDCRPFLQRFNRSDLPEGFSLTDDDDSVQKPESLMLTPKMTEFVSGQTEYLYPGTLVDWTSPVARMSRKNVKGYLMVWSHSTKDFCRLFKFNTSKTEWLSKKLRFQYHVKYLEPKRYFEFKVYSLPPPENLEDSQKTSTFVSQILTSGSFIQNYENPGDWVPSLSASVLNEGAIQVKIGHSPYKFNLTEFEVMLVKRSFDDLNAFKTNIYSQSADSQSSEGMVTFNDLNTDEYKIVVHVIDVFHKIDDKCLCWTMETKGRHCKLSCGSIATDWMNVTGAVIDTKTSEGPPGNEIHQGTTPKVWHSVGDDNDAKVTAQSDDFTKDGIIIGICAAAVLIFVAVIAVLGFRHYKRKGMDTSSSSDCSSPKDLEKAGLKEKAPILKHKTILIVSTEDNPAHTKFVQQLAKFLKNHCMCYVIDPPWEILGSEFSEWVKWSRSAIGAADKILLVDSPMAESLLGTFNQTKIFMNDSPTPRSHANQMFKLTLDYIWAFPDHLSNFIMLHLREECGSCQYLKAPIRIQLPAGFPQLLRSVHKLTEEEAKAYTNCLPLSLNYERSEDGINSDLVSALLSAQRPLLKSFLSEKSDDTGFGSDVDNGDNISTASSRSLDNISIPGELFMKTEAENPKPPSLSNGQVAYLPHVRRPVPEQNSEASSDVCSVFTVAIDPLIKAPVSSPAMQLFPPEHLDWDGRSFTSIFRDFNKDSDGWSC
ncbi:hypothetical protein EGW08_010974 [Elysia chlorotica]|uniref:Uncharacterized protein n=1 Tax=Elysia chlorotica TaxID=188477 RepID=A0A3S1HKD0_ELYCH|nr:hypothetical protein EGW08_010974 [Elysia chlorotica]